MMNRCHRILCKSCKPFQGECRWIFHEVSRRNILEGKQKSFSQRKFKIDEWEMKNKTSLLEVIGQRS